MKSEALTVTPTVELVQSQHLKPTHLLIGPKVWFSFWDVKFVVTLVPSHIQLMGVMTHFDPLHGNICKNAADPF